MFIWCLYLGYSYSCTILFAFPTASPHMLANIDIMKTSLLFIINAADVTDGECLFCNGLMCLKNEAEGNSVSSFHSKITMISGKYSGSVSMTDSSRVCGEFTEGSCVSINVYTQT